MKTTTWTRESHGLFDYESTYISKKQLKALSSAKILRIKNDIHLMTDILNDKVLSENSKVIATLRHNNGK